MPGVDDAGAALGDMLADTIEGINKSGQDFEKMQQESYAPIKEMRESIMKSAMDRLNGRQKKDLPEDVQAIVNVLLVQPRLVPAVSQFLQKLVLKINTSVDQIISDLLKEDSEPDKPS